MTDQITLKDVSKSYLARPVLHQVSCSISPGEHIGIVGENGSGKSTLIRLIAGLEAPDDGTVTVNADGGIGYLAQTPDFPPSQTVQDAVDWALADLRALERKLREAESALASAGTEELAEYGELLTKFEMRGGYEADARVDAAMHGLGLGHIDREHRLGDLSGGELSRLAIACMVASAPEILLLDEPTNHLDDDALEWLENSLRGRKSIVVVVSHDRVFLDRVASSILEVDGDRHAVSRYGDGYDGFLAAKAAARKRWEQVYAEWLSEIEQQKLRSETTAHRVGYGQRWHSNKVQFNNRRVKVQRQISSRVRNALERLERLRDNPVPRPPDPLRFRADLSGTATEGVLAELTDVVVRSRLTVDQLTINAGERLLLFGPNGSGKSTLLGVLAEQLEPDSGRALFRGRIGYLPQQITVTKPRRRLLSAFAEGTPGTLDEHVERLTALGLFRRSDFVKPVGDLSIGQQRRLTLARLLVRKVDLLLLDEPTNHLSLTLVDELEEALNSYAGALVVATHDRLMRGRFSGQQKELRNGYLVG